MISGSTFVLLCQKFFFSFKTKCTRTFYFLFPVSQWKIQLWLLVELFSDPSDRPVHLKQSNFYKKVRFIFIWIHRIVPAYLLWILWISSFVEFYVRIQKHPNYAETLFFALFLHVSKNDLKLQINSWYTWQRWRRQNLVNLHFSMD